MYDMYVCMIGAQVQVSPLSLSVSTTPTGSRLLFRITGNKK